MGLACFSLRQLLTKGHQHGYSHNLMANWASLLSQTLCWARGDNSGQESHILPPGYEPRVILLCRLRVTRGPGTKKPPLSLAVKPLFELLAVSSLFGQGGWGLSEITHEVCPACHRLSINVGFPPSPILLSFGAFLHSCSKRGGALPVSQALSLAPEMRCGSVDEGPTASSTQRMRVQLDQAVSWPHCPPCRTMASMALTIVLLGPCAFQS